jgi:hypothetical protein
MGLLGRALQLNQNKRIANLTPWKSFEETDFLAFIEPIAGRKDSLVEIPFLYSELASRFELPPSLLLVPSYSGGILTPIGFHGLNKKEACFFRMAITEDLEGPLDAKKPFHIEDALLQQNLNFSHFSNPSAPAPSLAFPLSTPGYEKGLLLFFGLTEESKDDPLFLRDCQRIENYLCARLTALREDHSSENPVLSDVNNLDAWSTSRIQKIKHIQKTAYVFFLNLQGLMLFFGELGLFLDPILVYNRVLAWLKTIIGEWGDLVVFEREKLVFILPGSAKIQPKIMIDQILKSFHKEFNMVSEMFSPDIQNLEIIQEGPLQSVNWDSLHSR